MSTLFPIKKIIISLFANCLVSSSQLIAFLKVSLLVISYTKKAQIDLLNKINIFILILLKI